MKSITKFALIAVVLATSTARADEPKQEWSATIDNPYLPLSKVPFTALERKGKKLQRVERRVADKPEKVGDVECLVLVETETFDGKPHEVTKNYFAQKDGAVWCFGEEVDNYKGGKIANHDGSWKVGGDAKEPTLFMPAAPKKGDKFRMEDVKGKAEEDAEILSVSESLKLGDVKYENLVEIKATDNRDGTEEFCWYAKDVGVIRVEEDKNAVELVKIGEDKDSETPKDEGSGK